MISSHHRNYSRPALTAVLALLLFGSAAITPAAGAQGSQTVEVTASVDTFLTITLCDLSANFGSGLSAIGSTPQNTTDDIVATSQGTNPGEGVFYRWTPSCQSAEAGNFMNVESNTAWRFAFYGTPNTGTNPDLTLADLRFSGVDHAAYADVSPASGAFPDCNNPPAFSPIFTGNSSSPTFYYPRIDDDVSDGSFAVSTTWQVAPA
ncbi:MAG: hypothetical protein ACRDJW_09060 [Thermomicrobiales bacterium]